MKKKRFQREDPTGIIYLSNLPFGFYETSLTKFLSQFGDIKRLKVKRSDKNSNPMGYAYVEFAIDKVAQVVAKTMNNYLLFNRLLKCKLVHGNSNIIFRKRNLTPEFCNGTKRKRKNQIKLEKADEEKVMKRVEKSRAKLYKALGSKVDSQFLLQTSKNSNSKNSDMKPSKGINFPNSSNSFLQVPLVNIKNITNKMEEPKFTSNETDLQLKTPEKSTVTCKNSFIKDTPIYMDIEEEDDEIQIKTPPNVIKRFRKSTKMCSLLKKNKNGNKNAKLDKKSGAASPSNEMKIGLKRQRKASTKVPSMGGIFKLGLTRKNNKNKLKREKTKKEIHASANLGQSSTHSINEVATKKSANLKRKANSETVLQTVTSKKLKLSNKKIQKGKKANQKSQVKLLSFKKKDLQT